MYQTEFVTDSARVITTNGNNLYVSSCAFALKNCVKFTAFYSKHSMTHFPLKFDNSHSKETKLKTALTYSR